jgi:sugar lactone lactonase YvrE
MSTNTGKIQCAVCDKEKATLRCGGCLREFCYNHWEPHRQELNKQFEDIEINRDSFRQTLTQHIEQPNNDRLIQQIDQWEKKSIKRIQQTAKEARQALMENTNAYFHQLEIKLNELTNQLRRSREENDFNEINLGQFERELNKLTKELSEGSKISIREDSTYFISKIFVHVSENYHRINWIQNGVTIAGGNGRGNQLNQLKYPCGIVIDDDQTIYVADAGNHRILQWEYGATNGKIVAGGDTEECEAHHLNWPIDIVIDNERNHFIISDHDNRRVVRWSRRSGIRAQSIISNIDCSRLTMDRNKYLYVSDKVKDEVRRWKVGDTHGTLVAGGNGKGHHLNQLNWPTFIFVDQDRSVYVSDKNNHRVVKWLEGAKEGIIVAGGQGEGNGLSQLASPRGVIVDHFGTVYVADQDNARVQRFDIDRS